MKNNKIKNAKKVKMAKNYSHNKMYQAKKVGTSNKSKTGTVFKAIGLTLLSLLLIVCIVLDVWFLIIKYRAPEKVVSNTFEAGLQKTTEGEERPVFEVKLHTNENKNGVQAFEMKINYMMDENQTSFYSQGLQYIANNGKLDWNYKRTGRDNDSKVKTKGWPTFNYAYDYYGRFVPGENVEMYNYASSDDYKTTYLSSNPIDNETALKIQLGEDLFLMKFRANEKVKNQKTFIRKSSDWDEIKFCLIWTEYYYYTYYAYMDYSFFIKTLLNSVQSLPKGTSHYIVFEFGDLFDYYKYDKDKGVYSDQRVDEGGTGKIIADMKSYYTIKVTVTADGLNKSQNSLFGMYKGQSNYNSTNDYVIEDYFYGRTIKNVTINDFIYVDAGTLSTFKLKLTDSFKEKYLKYADVIELKVNIVLPSELTFAGFTDDCFEGFKVIEIKGVK